jgi:hypothetical protein
LVCADTISEIPNARRGCVLGWGNPTLKRANWSGTMTALKAGDVAPDFEVPAVLGETKTRFRLSNFKGRRNVVLAFYALDWTPT